MKKMILIVLMMIIISPVIVYANPISVNIPGSFQSEIGCSGDWQPDCVSTYLSYDGNEDVWQNTFSIPAGNWEYKGALNGTWDLNYGVNAQPGGANIGLNLGAETSVKFYYDDKTHWITDNINSIIATVPGSYQDEIGCSGDWDPTCLRSWLQDPDGDGIYGFSALLPAGSYDVKVAINESWDENYGAEGAPGGANIQFSVFSLSEVFFTYYPTTHILEITQSEPAPVPEPATMFLLGTGLVGVACAVRRRKKK